ncbi:MAG TPA: diacylglycerol kinase family protein [bacterium]|jgi:diacylglycerol kinase (ATP)|nr:diacylglycerol kinase family protein [bacterium]HOC90083.1 diacylglycerol kinase family protein [bacterium]HOZ21229.1 diacylglycerol kinase family protein [bacterium]
MESKNKFSLRRRVASFGYAFAGIRQMLQTQHNAWIHLAATVLVIIAAFVYQLSRAEWIAVIAAMALVWSAEAVNTAFEFLCDIVHPGFYPAVEKAKNIAAAAVLICAAGAVVIGALVFIPHLLQR